MSVLVFSGLIFIISILGGILGALTGLGGGIIVIPALVILFDINIHYAMGASLISVIATSSGSSIAYLRDGIANIRVGMVLEVAAVLGAFCGALLLPHIPKQYIEILFALILIYSAFATILSKPSQTNRVVPDKISLKLKLGGTYKDDGKITPYEVTNIPFGFSIMGIAGVISGLLGIGAGSVSTLAMDQALGLPYKVATTTSNFMIGMTAAVSVGVYFSHGFVIPEMVFPVVLGVLLGSYLGAQILKVLKTKWLKIIFSVAVCLLAIEMLNNAI